jgi:hypothetical protein
MGLERLAHPMEAFLRGACVDPDPPLLLAVATTCVEGPRPSAAALSIHPEEGVNVTLKQPFQHGNRIYPGNVQLGHWT